MRQVLLLLDSFVLFGRERGNIDVIEYLRSREQSVLVAVNGDLGGENLGSHLRTLDIPWLSMSFHDRLGRDTTIRGWWAAAMAIAKANCQMAMLLIRRPTAMIQISNPQTLMNFLPLLWLIRTPVVFRCGDTPVATTKAHRWLWKVCFRRVNKIVPISKHVKKCLIALGGPSERIEVIYSRPFYRQAIDTFRAPKKTADVVLGYVGQLESHKGIDHLLEACARLVSSGCSIQLWVAGRTTEFWQQLCVRYTSAKWLCDLGFVSDTQGFYSAIDLLVVPSVCEEALGGVVLEAKEGATASVVYPRGGLPEMIRQGVDGWICGGPNVNSLVDALKGLCGDPQKIHAMGQSAKASVKGFNEQFERGWSKVYAL